ncbi:TNF receptor-associated factor 6 [Rhynchospora pubera]|uniref:TNF receptor-associated factor 6 n=1 Tax=Rhynchospora pubera TaxID=906938 RepID=A0AAV8C9S0_9POAL|nr:TNF receptor-associated factor 6 [Rhynchospora pubera]
MGFDTECIVNIQSLPGEYFCPVCRTLIYPTEALQTQCTHLYCKPCLAHTVATTQACPYDGYLVTEADSKPLMELNKPLADLIGNVQVHCLYYRSSCQWQGTLSDCIVHCATCAYGNSPVLCNRCGTQIMHRQVQEHAQVCPVLPPQATQPVDPNQPQAAANATQFSGQNAYATPTASAAAIGAPVPASAPGAADQAGVDQWYQQQYYQQYPGYDPYAQYSQQPQHQMAPGAVQPPQSQPVHQMQAPVPQNVPPQPPHLQPQQQAQPPQLQQLAQHPPLQPLPNQHLHQQLTPQGQNPTPSSVTGYSSYPQPQHAPAQQPFMHMLPPQQPVAPPPQGPYAPPPYQAPPQGPPHLHGQPLLSVPPVGLNHGTPPPPQVQPSPTGSSKLAFTDETNGKIKELLKEKGSDDKAAGKAGPIPGQSTPPVTLPYERYTPYGHSPDMPPHGHGQIRMPHNGSVRPYGEAYMRPSMGTSPQTLPDAFDPKRGWPLSPFEPPLAGAGMVRSNGMHAPLHDEGLNLYPRPPLEGLSRYERPPFPSNQSEFYGRGGPEFDRGPPPFKGPGRQEYGGTPYHKFGADYERSRVPFNYPPPSSRSGARRFGEPAGYSRYGGPGQVPTETFGATGKGSSIERPRKRRFSTGGWCRICKINCGTVEGLESHSQSKDHKKMAMDMILSIKQQVFGKPNLLVEREVAAGISGSHDLELDTILQSRLESKILLGRKMKLLKKYRKLLEDSIHSTSVTLQSENCRFGYSVVLGFGIVHFAALTGKLVSFAFLLHDGYETGILVCLYIVF